MRKKHLSLLGVCLFLAACISDPVESEFSSGRSATVQIQLQVADHTSVSTRSVSSATAENSINNLFLAIFDAQGERLFGQYYEATAISGGVISVTCPSGTNRRIYAVANIGLGMMNLEATDLERVQTETEWLALSTNLLQTALERGSSFLMSGFVEDQIGQLAPIDIPSGISSSPIATIRLRRVDSKFMFRVSTPSGVVFTPRDWRVVKAPQTVSLYSGVGYSEFEADTDYFTSSWANFEGTGTAFSFYLLENKHPCRQPIPTTADGITLTADQRYALRDKQEKLPAGSEAVQPGQSEINGAYLYAPENASFVQMRGYLIYTKDGVEVSADVIYTIHLGYANGDVDDYTNLRNCYYTYNIRIESVDKILVEVREGEENQPGAEGDVTLAARIYELDAHYETLSVLFSRAQIDESLTWYVSTPFAKGSAENNPADYQWVLFRLSALSGTNYSTALQSYPGDSKYTPGAITYAQFLLDKNRLLDVRQLISILQATQAEADAGRANLFDANQQIRFTAFVNENYYEQNPLDGSSPGDLWKQFVNQPQRVLHILSNIRYSPDGQSSESQAIVSFRQASIQTMYDLTASTQRAWGSEMIQDENSYAFWSSYVQSSFSYSVPSYNSTADGRANTQKLWSVTSNPTWSTFIDASTRTMKSNYAYVRYNCMRMNRDNDGDGVIDKNEVRWYLAAINQLTDLWIGENSFDLTARLYKLSTWQERWYASSTVSRRYQSGGSGFSKLFYDDPTVLWSSEGSSIGPMSAASKTKLHYRCLRNLGSFGDADSPEDFAQYDASTGTIDLSKLDAKSIRGYTQQAELQEHHERSADNKPWRAFRVSGSSIFKNWNWIQMRDSVNTGRSPCPAGWRVPTQRELALMMTRVVDQNWTAGNHLSRTRFQFNPVGGTRHGFAVAASNSGNAVNLFLINTNDERGGVRCVKDVTL